MARKLISTAALYHHSCRRKRRHESKGKAEAAARALDRRTETAEGHVAYFCPACRGWHVGRKLTQAKE